jgi:hypothetical protein
MESETPKCTAVFDDAAGGVRTSRQLVQGLSLLMGDLAAGRITNGRANAICNAAGKILTTVKLEHQYGNRGTDGSGPLLELMSSSPNPAAVSTNGGSPSESPATVGA